MNSRALTADVRSLAFSALALLASTVLLAAVSACDRDTEERHLAEMTNEIDHLQVDRDEANREVLSTDVADTHFSSVPQRTPAPSSVPPPIVGVGDAPPSPDTDSADTEDPSPRPTIRVIGSQRARADTRDVAAAYMDDGTGGTTPHPSALDPATKHEYDAALALVNAKQYDRALDALAAFLVKWPDHPYADNALFWRGECYYARADYLHAAEQFEGVVTRFPAGNKAPDALLKLGMSQQKLGNPTKAKEYFDRLAQTYPQSDAAHRIPPVTVQATTPPGPAPEDHR
jgi:tol-pal system protein YbgF